MKSLLLINVESSDDRVVTPPLGLYSIRAAIQNAPEPPFGNVTVWDEDLLGHVRLEEWPKDIEVGLSVRFASQHRRAVQLKLELQARDLKFAIGGTHGHYVLGGWKGSGEDFYKVTRSQPNITVKEMEPYWARGKPHDKTLTDRWMPVSLSRGCAYDCAFCASKDFYCGITKFPIVKTLQELADLGIRELLIEDDCLNSKNLEAIGETCERYRLWWSLPNGVNIRAIQSAKGRQNWCHLWRVCLPFETFNPETQRKMGLREGKRFTFEEAWEVVKSFDGTLTQPSVETCGFFIIGWPGEDMLDVLQTLLEANKLPLTERHIYIATPYPGTALYDYCVRHNLLLKRDYDYYRYDYAVISSPTLSAHALTRARGIDRLVAVKARSLASPSEPQAS